MRLRLSVSEARATTHGFDGAMFSPSKASYTPDSANSQERSMHLLALLLVANTAAFGGNGHAPCAATPRIREVLATLGTDLRFGADHPNTNSATADTSGLVCGELNGDDQQDVCGVILQAGKLWKVGCFMSGKGGHIDFEPLLNSSHDSEHEIPPDAVDLTLARNGQSIDWANGAARITFSRDCIGVTLGESFSNVYCYNGAHFLQLGMTD